MPTIIDGTSGVTFPAGGVGNPAGAVVGTTDTQTLTNKSIVASQLTGTQTIPRGTLPTGSVLQVVNATYSTQTTSTSSTYADTGLTATITPTSSSSKILVLVSQNGNLVTGYGVGTAIQFKLLRGASLIAFLEELNSYQGDASGVGRGGGSTCISYLDSPATTSATTYKTQFANRYPSGTMYIQFSSSVSSMTLMEIAA